MLNRRTLKPVADVFKRITQTSFALACLSTTGASWAQSSVTIYGIVDTYVGSVKDSRGTVSVLQEGRHTVSRLGFRGSEDLGGGLAAYFVAEMGLTVDTGAIPLGGGFGRQSFVGLRGPWAAVELGRGYTPAFFNMLAAGTFGMNANWAPLLMSCNATHLPTAARTLGFPLRQSNLVRVRLGNTINQPGFRAEATVSAGEGDPAVGRSDGLALSWRGGNLYLGLAGQRTRSGTATATQFHNDLQVASLSWKLNALTLNANYIVTDSSAPSSQRAKHVVLGAAYRWGPHAALIEANDRKVTGSPNDSVAVTLGYDYNFSRRTTVYARALDLQNSARAANTLAFATVSANSGADVKALALGVRHTF